MSNFVAGHGSSDAKLMIVAEAPGEEEAIQGKTLVGPTGVETQKLIENAGEKWTNVYKTNVFKWRPPENDIKRYAETGHTWEEAIDLLEREIQTIKPNCILTLGETAFSNVTNYKKLNLYRGSILESKYGYPKVVPAIHPARLWKHEVSYSNKVILQWDVNKAVAQSKFKEFRLPERNLQVARSSADLWRFLERYSDCTKVSVDIEVHKGIPTCVALAFNKHHALSVPVLGMSLGKNHMPLPDAEICEIVYLLAKFFAREDIQIIGQNFKFDHGKLLCPLGIMIRDGCVWFDTQIAASILYPELPRSLQFLTSIYTDEPYYKDEYKEYNPSKDSFDRVQTYNAKDAVVTFEVYECEYAELKQKNLLDFMFNHMMPQHDLYRHIERGGFPMDWDARAEAYARYIKLEREGDLELESLVGKPFNVRSNPGVKNLIENELKLPSMDGYGEDNLVALIANKAVRKNEKAVRILDLIMKQRQLKVAISRSLEYMPDYDDYTRSTYNIVGTSTGRSSTGIMDPPVRPHAMGVTYHGMPKHGWGADTKKQMRAWPGHYIVEFDMSQAEPRIVGHLGNDEWLNNLYKEGKDVHRYTAQLCLGLSDQQRDALAKDSPQRFIGKTVRNAGHYDARAKRLRDTINSDARKFGLDITVTQSASQLLLDTFHGKSKNIRDVFHVGIQEALARNNRTLVNPFGRPHQGLERWGYDLFKDMYAYIPQSTVKDHMAQAGLRIRKRLPNVAFVIEWHDAYYFMLEKSVYLELAAIIKEEMERPIDFERCSIKRGILHIPVESTFGENLYEMAKLKVAA